MGDDTPERELPVLHLLGLARTYRGWCVVSVTTQGTQVTDTEILHGPDTKTACGQQLQVEVARMLSPGRKPPPRGLN